MAGTHYNPPRGSKGDGDVGGLVDQEPPTPHTAGGGGPGASCTSAPPADEKEGGLGRPVSSFPAFSPHLAQTLGLWATWQEVHNGQADGNQERGRFPETRPGQACQEVGEGPFIGPQPCTALGPPVLRRHCLSYTQRTPELKRMVQIMSFIVLL